MKHKSYLIPALVLAGSIALTGQSLAEDHGAGYHDQDSGHQMSEHRVKKLARKLDLSDEQQEEMKALNEAHRSNTKELRKAMRGNRKALAEQGKADSFNSTEVERLAEQKGDLVRQLTVAKMEHRHAVAQLLNDEQRAKLKEMKQQRKERKKDRKSKRRAKHSAE